MSNSPYKYHPLQRDGKSQAQRVLTVLDPVGSSTVKVDERALSDILEFILRYSRQVKFPYFENTEHETSDWSTLFRQNPAFIIAAISKADTDAIRESFDKLVAEAPRFDDFDGVKLLLDKVQELVFQLHLWATELGQEENGLGLAIKGLIQTNLARVAQELIANSNAAKVWGYAPYRAFEDLKDLAEWGLDKNDFKIASPTFAKVRGSGRTKVLSAVKALSLLFGELHTALKDIVEQADAALETYLKSTSNHAPQMGLLFSFLKLFEKARNNPDDTTDSNLNAATKKHLDFFYKQVLNIKTKPAEPDKAHLVFELAKQLPPRKLDKGTAFKAGKDKNGVPIYFKLDDEVVVTKAQVADLRTLFLKKNKGAYQKSPEHDIVQDVFYAPVANSADGLGEDFPKEDTLRSWKTLGWEEGKLPQKGSDDFLKKEFVAYPQPRLGLVVASKVLHLEGGRRIIRLKMKCAFPVKGFDDLTNTNFKAFRNSVSTKFEITDKVINAASANKMSLLSLNYLKSLPFNKRIFTQFKVFLDEMGRNLMADSGFDTAIFENDQVILSKFISRHHVFDVELSGEKGWNKSHDVIFKISKKGKGIYLIKATIILDESYPPLIWYDASVLGENLGTNLPSIRLLLQQNNKVTEDSLYHFFRYLIFDTITIKAKVCNFRNLLVQTDDGVQDPTKPFLAFGALPKLGATFYLGSSEIFRKKWIDMVVNIAWKDKPISFVDYYQNYVKGGLDETKIVVKAKSLTLKKWKDLDPNVKQVFVQDTPTVLITCERDFAQSVWSFKNVLPIIADEDATPLESFNVFTKDGFASFELSGEIFWHEKFGAAFARQATAQAMWADNKPVAGAIFKKTDGTYHVPPTDGIVPADAIVELPNEPYTPVIEQISVDYTANAEKEDIQLFHLFPFEGTFLKKDLLDSENPPTVLPAFEDEGTLFLGISDLKPGENLDLLFQVAESTADPDETPPKIKWQYLRRNEWVDMQKDVDILSDETNGLLRSGVVKIAVPEAITLDNTVMPGHLHWLKASAAQRAFAVSETIAIHTQAAKATFAPEQGSFTGRLSDLLKAGTISKPLQENAAIKKTEQPYNSFGGQTAESSPAYYQRVSERLRHKGRAITLYDYERLVLEAFPEVYKVKCITHTLGLSEHGSDYHLAPGHVVVAVVPDLKNLPQSGRLRPKATRSLLNKIEDFLKKRNSPFVKFRALNPRYQEFRVSGNVRFTEGKSVEFYQKQLLEDLERFLAPWAFDEGDEIDFGGVVYKSVILNFIESLDYVDYVTEFKLLRKKENIVAFSAQGGVASPPVALSVIEAQIQTLSENGIDATLPVSKFEPKDLLELGMPKEIFDLPSLLALKDALHIVNEYELVDEIPADTARSILVAAEHFLKPIAEACCSTDGNARNDCMTGYGYAGVGNMEIGFNDEFYLSGQVCFENGGTLEVLLCDLDCLLSDWTNNERRKVEFGNVLLKNFLSERIRGFEIEKDKTYVRHIVDFKLWSKQSGKSDFISVNEIWAVSGKGVAIPVAHQFEVGPCDDP